MVIVQILPCITFCEEVTYGRLSSESTDSYNVLGRFPVAVRTTKHDVHAADTEVDRNLHCELWYVCSSVSGHSA